MCSLSVEPASVWLVYVGSATAPTLFGVYRTRQAARGSLRVEAVRRLDASLYPPWLPDLPLFSEDPAAPEGVGDLPAAGYEAAQLRSAWLSVRDDEEIVGAAFAFTLLEERPLHG